MTDANSAPVPKAPDVAWNWSEALLGAAYAVPAALVAPVDVKLGLSLAVGVLPAAIVGLAPTRTARRRTVVMGAIVGVPMVVGSLLAHVPWLAVIAVFGTAVGAAHLATRSRLGQLAMILGLPMMAIGFSYDDVGEAVGIAALMIAGSVFACLVSMLWPEVAPGPPPPPPPAPTLDYGIRLGLAGAVAALIGFGLDLDHVGWACGAALLVMRPARDMQELRSIGRICAVAAGALLAVAWTRIEPAAGWYSVAIIGVLAAAAGTHRSRWYVTSAFTTYLVFLLLLYSSPEDAQSRFNERVGETLLGVALACLFGLVLPMLRPPTVEAS